jgi:superfamily II DNA or RNA helicase
MNQTALVADVVDTWIDRGQNRPTLCFAVDRAHAKHLQTKFETAGIPTGYVDYVTPANERTEIGRRLRTGELKVVVNVTCLTIGIDWAEISCLILARPTKSEMLFVQMVGRGLRTADGKSDCLILDHSGNHLRLGFVPDIGHDHLDDDRERKVDRKEQEALPKKCPKCSYLRPPGVHICPACGFAPEPRSTVVNRDGELVEFVSRNVVKAPSYEEKAQFYQQLKYYCRERGYQRSWVAHKFREKFGVWPRGLDDLPPLPPTPTTRNWIRSRQIAFAKSRSSA